MARLAEEPEASFLEIDETVTAEAMAQQAAAVRARAEELRAAGQLEPARIAGTTALYLQNAAEAAGFRSPAEL